MLAHGFALTTSNHPRVAVAVFANDRPVGNWEFLNGQPPRELKCRIPQGDLDQNSVVIRLEIHDPATPKSLQISTDDRLLGMALQTIQFRLASK